MPHLDRSKRMLLVRGGLLTMALALAVAAWLSVGAASSDHAPARSQLNGRTAQGFVIWARQTDGAVTTFRALWRGRCTGDATWPWSVHTFRTPRDRFAQRGRRFFVAGGYDRSRPGGWVAHVTEAVRGEIGRDRRTAKGFLRGHVSWTHDGRRGPVCNSGRVHWQLAASGP